MATKEDVLAVLEAMKDRMDDPDFQKRLGSYTKTLQFDCTDLGAVYVMELKEGRVVSLEEKSLASPDIALAMPSDTFIGIANGEINAMSAFMSGKIQAKAAFPDLLMLQQLLG